MFAGGSWGRSFTICGAWSDTEGCAFACACACICVFGGDSLGVVVYGFGEPAVRRSGRAPGAFVGVVVVGDFVFFTIVLVVIFRVIPGVGD